MDLHLSGKTVLVTAASQGLGKAIAKRFVEEGAKTFICARNADQLSLTAAEIGATGIVCDVTDSPALEAMLKTIGPIDILVTNAGGPKPGKFSDITNRDWEDAFQLTLLSAIKLIRSTLPHMQQQHWGRIICLTSTSVKQPIKNLITSNSIRSAVANLAKTLSQEVGEFGITVNVVAPGMFTTQRLDQLIQSTADQTGYMFDEEKDKLQRTIPVRRFGNPDELAAAVTFLASDQAAYINGILLPVDGGFTNHL